MAYCEKYGFNQKRRNDFLRLIDLSDDDSVLVKQLHDNVLQPCSHLIIDEFYVHMLQQSEFVEIITRRRIDIDNLKKTQKDYLLNLGINCSSEDYFESRLRIGLAHAWNGVPLNIYLAAYRKLQQLIIDHITHSFNDGRVRYDIQACLLKILTLDMLLAVETYYVAQVDVLEDTVDTLRNHEKQLLNEVSTDKLTKLASRSHVLEILNNTFIAARRDNKSLSLIMADLDHFKEINDNYGHQVGDQVLMGIAGRIKASVRNIDTAGRYGGEEFIIVLPTTDMITAQQVAERIREQIASSPLSFGDNMIDLTISEGIATLNPDDTVESLIKRADSALYIAKQAGRNRVELAS